MHCAFSYCRYLDYILLMGYDFYGPWSTYTGIHSALFPRDEEVGDQRYENVVRKKRDLHIRILSFPVVILKITTKYFKKYFRILLLLIGLKMVLLRTALCLDFLSMGEASFWPATTRVLEHLFRGRVRQTVTRQISMYFSFFLCKLFTTPPCSTLKLSCS